MFRKLAAFTGFKKTTTEPFCDDWETIQPEEVRTVTDNAQILALAQESVTAGLIPQDVLDHLISLNHQVPTSMRQRYLLTHIHNSIKDKESLFMKIIQVFLKHQPEFLPESEVAGIHAPCDGADKLASLSGEECRNGTADEEELLTSDHIPDLVELLVSHSFEWRSIGVALRFQPQELDNIEASPSLLSNAPKSYLIRVLEDWLQGKCKHTRPPTKSSLERALSSHTVGLGIVADKVRVSCAFQRSATTSNSSDPSPPYLEVYVSLEAAESTADEGRLVSSGCKMNIRSSDFFVEESSSILLEVKTISGFKASFNYEWRRNGQTLRNTKEYSLAGPILCIIKADIDMEGDKFSCRITSNSLEHAIETTPVTLNVTCPLDEHKYDL